MLFSRDFDTVYTELARTPNPDIVWRDPSQVIGAPRQRKATNKMEILIIWIPQRLVFQNAA
mgnify:CR=1 FL=1